MKWLQLENEETFRAKLLRAMNWEDSFIREISVVSPSYILPDISVVAPNCLPSVRVFISSQSAEIPGIELLFVEVEELSVHFTDDLTPNVSVINGKIIWKFCDSLEAPIMSKSLYYRFLRDDTWGKGLRYGWEEVFDIGGELSLL